MSEVKRYIENLIPGHPPPVVEASDGYLCLYTDFQSERLAHEKTKVTLAKSKRWIESIEKAFERFKEGSSTEREKWAMTQLKQATDTITEGTRKIFSLNEKHNRENERIIARLHELENILRTLNECNMLSDEQNKAYNQAIQNSQARSKS